MAALRKRRHNFEGKLWSLGEENSFVILSGHGFVLSQRCSVSPLFILGLILPAVAVGFSSAVPERLTPVDLDPLRTDGPLSISAPE